MLNEKIKLPCYTATFKIPYKTYMATLQLGMYETTSRLVNSNFVYRTQECAGGRRKALDKVCNWYWDKYKGAWGQAHEIMVLNDPYMEVMYNDDFNCADKLNRYLDDETIDKLLSDCNEELVREDNDTFGKHHPRNSVKRKKRRRVYLEHIGDGLYQHPNTKVMYFRDTVIPQITHNGSKGHPGEYIQKRKVKDFKLMSKNIEKAINEVQTRFGHAISLG